MSDCNKIGGISDMFMKLGQVMLCVLLIHTQHWKGEVVDENP